jgi:hypothetical protein
MMDWLAHFLKLHHHQRYDQDCDATVTKVKVNLQSLEDSQTRLRQSVEDTGFFLGDAMVRQAHERTRATNYNR